MANLQGIIPPGAGQFNARDRTVVTHNAVSGSTQSISAKAMIARDRLSESTKEQLKKEFQDIDADHDGRINKAEFKDYIREIIRKDKDSDENLKEHKMSQVDRTVEELFKIFDADGNGEVSMNEFVAYYVETKQQTEDKKVVILQQTVNRHTQWQQVTKKYREVQKPENQRNFQPILKITIVDAQNLADNIKSKVVVKHQNFSEFTNLRDGPEPIWNETIIFVELNPNQPVSIGLEDVRGKTIAGEDIYLTNFQDYSLVDDNYVIFKNVNSPNKNEEPRFSVRINYHYSDVEKYRELNEQYQKHLHQDLFEYAHVKTFLRNLNDPFKFMSTLTSGVMESFDEHEIKDVEDQYKQQKSSLGVAMNQVEKYMLGPADRYGFKEIPWLNMTKFFLTVQVVLCALSGYFRADFLTLTAVAIAWYYITNPANVRVPKFRQVVYLIAISLVYDLIYFQLIDTRDDENGNVMKIPKQVSLYSSYLSFFWKIPMLVILFKDSLDFIGIVKNKKTKTGVEDYERSVEILFKRWGEERFCCDDHEEFYDPQLVQQNF